MNARSARNQIITIPRSFDASRARVRRMGGHGGLNILPQKSWNVYGTKQRARVRRDEENARLEAEANAAEARDEARDERWRALRESGSRPREERVHLFEAEERAAMRAEERTRRGEDAGTRDASRAPGAATTIDSARARPTGRLPIPRTAVASRNAVAWPHADSCARPWAKRLSRFRKTGSKARHPKSDVERARVTRAGSIFLTCPSLQNRSPLERRPAARAS